MCYGSDPKLLYLVYTTFLKRAATAGKRTLHRHPLSWLSWVSWLNCLSNAAILLATIGRRAPGAGITGLHSNDSILRLFINSSTKTERRSTCYFRGCGVPISRGLNKYLAHGKLIRRMTRSLVVEPSRFATGKCIV